MKANFFATFIKGRQWETKTWGKADLHLHTSYSDGYMSPADTVVMIAEQASMDVVAITDHDTTEGAFIALDYARQHYPTLDIIIGQEVTTGDGDIVGLFLRSTLPKFTTALEAIQAIHEQGGLAVAVHPFIYGWNMESVGKAILYLPFDAVEVRHGCPLSIPGNIWASWMNYFGQQLPALGNSDSHLPFTIGQAFTWFPGHTSLDLRQAIAATAVRPGGTTWKVTNMARQLRYISEQWRGGVPNSTILFSPAGYEENHDVDNGSDKPLHRECSTTPA